MQAESNDPVVQMATFDPETAGFAVPARTTAVFVIPEGSASGLKLDGEDRIEVEARLEPEPTATQPEPTTTVPTPSSSTPEPTLPSAALTPEPLDTGSSVWPWVVAVIVVIGGIAAWAWRRLR